MKIEMESNLPKITQLVRRGGVQIQQAYIFNGHVFCLAFFGRQQGYVNKLYTLNMYTLAVYGKCSEQCLYMGSAYCILLSPFF